MSRVSRRDFLAQAAVAAGATALAGLRTPRAPAAPAPLKGTDLVTLGKSKIQTTILGIGTGTVGGQQQRDLGQEGFIRLARHAYDRGIRYIDTADMYQMHPFIRAALRQLPREELFIQTKTRAQDAQKAEEDIERFRREMGIDHLDTLLMHCMQKSSWPADMRPVMDVLYEAKQKGRVRAVGISSHGLEPLVASVEPDWIDVSLVRINPFDLKMDGSHEEVAAQIKKIHQQGRGVIGMKIYGEDGLGTRQRRFESLKYVLGLGCVDAFTIGFTRTDQIDETLELIEQASA